MQWFTLVLVTMLSVGFGLHLDNQHIHKGTGMTTTVTLLPEGFTRGKPDDMTFFGKPLAAYGPEDLKQIVCWQHNQWIDQMQQNRQRIKNLVGC
jgi:hypothetical protein